jgi:hypothetical protein
MNHPNNSEKVRALAKLGLAGGISKQHVLEQISIYCGSDYNYIVEHVYGCDKDIVLDEVLLTTKDAETVLQSGSGIQIDINGHDQADRTVLSMLSTLGQHLKVVHK